MEHHSRPGTAVGCDYGFMSASRRQGRALLSVLVCQLKGSATAHCSAGNIQRSPSILLFLQLADIQNCRTRSESCREKAAAVTASTGLDVT